MPFGSLQIRLAKFSTLIAVGICTCDGSIVQLNPKPLKLHKHRRKRRWSVTERNQRPLWMPAWRLPNLFSNWLRTRNRCGKRQLLSNPVLNGTTVEYQIRKPFVTLSEMKLDQKWRRERDSNSREVLPSAPLARECLRPLGHLSESLR